jgi:FkbM family methyltransferase
MSTKLTLNPSWPIFELAKKCICLDVGASNGGMAESMLNEGASKVYCIEAGAKHVEIMKERFTGNPNIEILETAVGDETGILKNVTWLNAWTIGNPNEINLPVSPGACDIEGHKLVDIKMDTIDNIFKDSTEDIGFIKIDVDGYDFKVLKGSEKLIQRCRPVIFIELSFYYNFIKGSSVEAFFLFVESINYKFISLDGIVCTTKYVRDEFPFHSSCDVFLCPSEKLHLFSNRITKVL